MLSRETLKSVNIKYLNGLTKILPKRQKKRGKGEDIVTNSYTGRCNNRYY